MFSYDSVFGGAGHCSACLRFRALYCVQEHGVPLGHYLAPVRADKLTQTHTRRPYRGRENPYEVGEANSKSSVALTISTIDFAVTSIAEYLEYDYKNKGKSYD